MRGLLRSPLLAAAALLAILAPGLSELAADALADSDCGDACGDCPSEDADGPGCCGALFVSCGCACSGAAPVEVASAPLMRIAYALRADPVRKPLPPLLDDWQREIFHPPAA